MAEDYTPPEIWTFDEENGGQFASINRPTAGAREEKELPQGEHPFQLYSLATPNGQKASILFEELLEAGHPAQYDAWMINIGKAEQFGSGFVALNPNSKIPALLDRSGTKPFRVFESAAIMVHLAEKFDFLLPKDPATRAETFSWLMFQMGTAPFIGGGFGHFYRYAPVKIKYPIDRYSMETKRIFSVVDSRLAESEYLAGDEYTIADIANYAWLSALWHGAYDGGDKFLQLHENRHVGRWIEALDARPGVIRGRLVNSQDMPERHSPADFEAVEDRSLFDPVRRRSDT